MPASGSSATSFMPRSNENQPPHVVDVEERRFSPCQLSSHRSTFEQRSAILFAPEFFIKFVPGRAYRTTLLASHSPEKFQTMPRVKHKRQIHTVRDKAAGHLPPSYPRLFVFVAADKILKSTHNEKIVRFLPFQLLRRVQCIDTHFCRGADPIRTFHQVAVADGISRR